MYTVESIHGFTTGVRLVGAGFLVSPHFSSMAIVTVAVGGAAHSAPLSHTARHSERSEETFTI